MSLKGWIQLIKGKSTHLPRNRWSSGFVRCNSTMEDDPEWHTNRGIDVPTTIPAEEEITREFPSDDSFEAQC